MVRFTVRDGSNGSSIRMEMEGCDMLDGVREAAEEYWGRGRVMLVRDYKLLDPESNVDDSIDEDDVIDVNERLLKKVCKDAIGLDVQLPLPRMPLTSP